MIPKSQLFKIHKWCGLLASLLILIQAVTGICEAYGSDFARLFDPAAMVRQSQGKDAPLQEVLQALRFAYPDQRVERIVFPETPTEVFFVHLRDVAGEQAYVSMDPGTAAILRAGSLWAFPMEAAARIHYDYTIGTPGMAIVTLVGVLGIVMLATGLAYWWPRPGRRLQQLKINWQAPGKFVLRQVHRSTGVIMSLFIGYSLVTGAAMACYYFVVSAGAPTAQGASETVLPAFDLDDVVDRARTEYPEHGIRDIRFVGANRANVYFNAPERSPRAAHKVGIDLDTATIVDVQDARSNTELWVTLLPLHAGQYFGVLGLALVTVNALVLLGLASTGPIMWWHASRRRRSRK